MGERILDVEGLEVRRGSFRVGLPRLALSAGEVAVLLGPSGCGKTSLLLAILGLLREGVSGRVDLLARGLPAPNRAAGRGLLFDDVAVVMQDALASLDPLVTVGDQLAAATGSAPKDSAMALGDLGVQDPEDLLRRRPHQLSVGQAQRCLLAVALLRRPKLLIADEPSASLDGDRITDLEHNLKLLRDRTGTAVLIATHDHRLAADLDAVGFLFRNGELVEGSLAQVPWPDRRPGAKPGPVVLAGRGLGHRYGDSWVLNRVDLELHRGQITALVGESGSGKSTLARILAGHLQPSRGSVQGPGRTGVQMLFQDAYGSLTPSHTIEGLVKESRVADFDLEQWARCLDLEPSDLKRPPTALSGGQRRRAALLRSLSVRPAVLILDEPTASLDRPTAIAVTHTLVNAQSRTGLAMLWITHDEQWASAFADRVLRLEGGDLNGGVLGQGVRGP
jgi:ABC-type glutathione transport system ATPase component